LNTLRLELLGRSARHLVAKIAEAKAIDSLIKHATGVMNLAVAN
jgi:hypothetical protein